MTKFPSEQNFCSIYANDGTKDVGGYCFKGEPFVDTGVPPFQGKEDGLCIEDIARPGPDHVTAVFSPDGRLFYANRKGVITVWNTSVRPFLSLGVYLVVPAVDTTEGGILGIAFHPNWPAVNRFFVVNLFSIFFFFDLYLPSTEISSKFFKRDTLLMILPSLLQSMQLKVILQLAMSLILLK